MTRAIVVCELCGEPLEADPRARELVCGCVRAEDPSPESGERRWCPVDYEEERVYGVSLGVLIVVERYGFLDGRPRSVAEVARARGISRSRVRKLEAATLTRMRWESLLRRSG